ncbi:hypothetical protein Ais01nite_03490 [Asanoa ishikariensis]|uniref:Uncharacterized protein n=1 Tax=Asanoa ishikariensis TaxID=137265 RepID=A0A1H3TLY1_9ACTN|nr:hypothetical protein [Asanoa ishikariensis]GIF62314.1 hypothetical protein Ais01nite_03490 [Asanoa ishikariensis]SDZ50349.1 hypothetical protein SAMN05421684_5881 [Asanoa ishikariensis]
MPGVEGALLYTVIMTKLRISAGLAPTAALGVGLAALLASNPLGMYDAKSEGWDQVSKRLGGMLAQIDQAMARGDDWIADDKDAFETSIVNFKTEVEALKKAADDAGSMLALTGTAFVTTYIAIATFVGAILISLIALAVMRLNPFTAAPATALTMHLGVMINFFISKAAIMFVGLATAGAAALAATLVGWLETDSAGDTLPEPARLEQLRIDYKKPAVFEAKSV